MDGDHTIERSFDVTCRVARTRVFTELRDQRVDFERTLLKPNMVLSGYEASDRAGVEEVAERDARRASTGTCRRRCPGSSSSPAARRTRTRPRT